MQFNQAPAPRESSLSDAYNPTADYSVDDLCIHDNVLCKCIVPISGGEAWNSAHWTETNIADEISALNSKLTDKNNEFIAIPDVSFHASNPYTFSIDPYEYDVLYCYIVSNNDTERRTIVTIPIRMQRLLLGTNTGGNKVYYLLPSKTYPEVLWLDITISSSGVVFKTSTSAIPAKLMAVYGVKHVE